MLQQLIPTATIIGFLVINLIGVWQILSKMKIRHVELKSNIDLNHKELQGELVKTNLELTHLKEYVEKQNGRIAKLENKK